MQDFLTALGLVLVIEGAFYGIYPDAAPRLLEALKEMGPTRLRIMGVVATLAGLGLIWAVRTA